MQGYPGSKAAAGVAEKIIRQFPPHSYYIELFAGHAAVYRRKRRAGRSVLIDLSPSTCRRLRAWIGADAPATEVVQADAMQLLRNQGRKWPADALVYVDPPYLRETRTRLLYEVEFHTRLQHAALLSMLQDLRCMVAVSSYENELYVDALRDWRCITFNAMTRGGIRKEWLWMNYPAATTLHDVRFAGGNFRERERMKKKKNRWAKRFAAMPPTERQLIASALLSVDRVALVAAMDAAKEDAHGG